MYIFQHDDDDEADDELYDNGKLYERGSLFSGFRWRVQEKSAQYTYIHKARVCMQLQMLSFLLKFFLVFSIFFLQSEIVFLTCNRKGRIYEARVGLQFLAI